MDVAEHVWLDVGFGEGFLVDAHRRQIALGAVERLGEQVEGFRPLGSVVGEPYRIPQQFLGATHRTRMSAGAGSHQENASSLARVARWEDAQGPFQEPRGRIDRSAAPCGLRCELRAPPRPRRPHRRNLSRLCSARSSGSTRIVPRRACRALRSMAGHAGVDRRREQRMTEETRSPADPDDIGALGFREAFVQRSWLPVTSASRPIVGRASADATTSTSSAESLNALRRPSTAAFRLFGSGNGSADSPALASVPSLRAISSA